jgi:hypothetical protein
MRAIALVLATAAAVALTAGPAAAQRVLFDARHGQTAGNADWIVDADSSEQEWLNFRCVSRSFHHSGQRLPTPPQSTIGPDTPETVWDGGISAWAVDLAKDALRPGRGRDWTIEQYPWNAPEMTFGDPTNPQDLANYDVLILCEPNVLFTDAEAQAIREFVASGGGLFLCADHETSDRNCSGGAAEVHDSPFILNRLMQTDVETTTTPPYFDPASPNNDFGVFGIWFYENGNDNEDDQANRAFDWFNEATSRNVAADPVDPILHGPFGDGTGGLGLFGSTQIAVSTHPERGNPTARAHIWRNGAPREANAQGVSARVTFASARFGAGRVVAVGDSSPADDGTGEGGLHDGWDKAGGGVANDVIFLNATEWLANPEPDVTGPSITGGPAAVAADCSAVVTWVTDEPASSEVAFGEGAAFDRSASAPGFAIGHEVTLTGLEPETGYRFRVASSDPAGNGPTESAAGDFATTATGPIGLADAAVETTTATAVTVSWTTAKPATGTVRAAAAAGVERTAEASEPRLEQTVTVAGLTPETAYQLTVEAADACGTTESVTFPATTAAAPASIDLSGWRLVNDNPDFVFTFPPGTEIAAGGTLVVGRANDRAGFEAAWGPLDPEVAYLDSGDELIVNATGRPYTLLDGRGEPVDGPTVKIARNASKARRDACLDAGIDTAWTSRSDAEADPGRGAPTACGAGVVITEMSDAGDFRNEFVEIYFDAGAATP